jgi:uncharacterized membrane protein
VAHLRFHAGHEHLTAPFGSGGFGKAAEDFARFFGTPTFLLSQTVIVAIWIVVNAVRFATYDPYPFILLNLAFSLQAAYAAPLILLAQTRQADRDKANTEADAQHREELARTNLDLLRQNTDLTEEVARLSRSIEKLTHDIHEKLLSTGSNA